MEFMKILGSTMLTLSKTRTVKEILKYVANVTLTYAANKITTDKIAIPNYKYDVIDNRNMVYQHNMNNNDKIDPILSDQAASLYKIDRFISELVKIKTQRGEDVTNLNIDTFLKMLFNITKNQDVMLLQEGYYNNPKLLNFDKDTLETTSIADSIEINSGNIILPPSNVTILTEEGENVANLKNEYLNKRIELGNTTNAEEVYKLLQEYHLKNKTNEVLAYYNKINSL